MKVRQPRQLNLAIGPPVDKAKDKEYVKHFILKEGLKVTCGGTTATLVARELGRELKVNFDGSRQTPPTGSIDGIDLVTEGIVTLCKTLDLIKEVEGDPVYIQAHDGAAELARMLLKADKVYFQVGQAINPAHQNPNLPQNLALKNQVVRELCSYLQVLGKEIDISFY